MSDDAIIASVRQTANSNENDDPNEDDIEIVEINPSKEEILRSTETLTRYDHNENNLELARVLASIETAMLKETVTSRKQATLVEMWQAI